MRGVVTLAAVFLIPKDTPGRPTLVLAAFVVVAGTLLLQGLTLPWLVRRLRLPTDDAVEDARQAEQLATAAGTAGIARLDEIAAREGDPPMAHELRDRALRRANQIREQLDVVGTDEEPPSAAYQRLRLEMLAAERDVIVRARNSGDYDDEVVREALHALDLEESVLDTVRRQALQRH